MEKKLFIAPNATIVSDVTLENNVSIWYGAVLRGDLGGIHIGENTNVQENCILHGKVQVGKGCAIGHGAILHDCTIGDNCMVGMGAVIFNGAVLGEHCMVGAGAVVTGKMNAPAGSLVLGNPAKVVKPLTQEQIDYIHEDVEMYLGWAQEYFG